MMRLIKEASVAIIIVASLLIRCYGIRVAIVGGGISSASTLYHIKSLLELNRPNSHITVDVFERYSNLGGRMQSVEFIDFASGSQSHYELGGSIIHEDNIIMKHFANILNLTTVKPTRSDERLGILNSTSGDYVVLTSTLPYFDVLQILYRYGPLNFHRFQTLIRNVRDRFMQLYPLLDKAVDASDYDIENFSTVKILLQAVNLYNLTQMSLERWLLSELFHKSSQEELTSRQSRLLHELITAAIRVNYNQNLSINALAGAVGLIPIVDSRLFIVQDGNNLIPAELIHRYADNVFLNSTITEIRRIDATNTSSKNKNAQKHLLKGIRVDIFGISSHFEAIYDAVILCAPLSLTGLTFFEYDEPARPTNYTEYHKIFQHTHTTFLKAQPIVSAFHHSEKLDKPTKSSRYGIVGWILMQITLFLQWLHLDQPVTLPGTLLTVESVPDAQQPVTHLSSVGSYFFDSVDNTTILKIFSRGQLSDGILEELFNVSFSENQICPAHGSESTNSTLVTGNSCRGVVEKNHQLRRKDWLAYPLFSPPEQFPPAILHWQSGLFYAGAFENALSCMEGQALFGKHVANLFLAWARRREI